MSKHQFYLGLKQEEKELNETLNVLRVLIKRYESENEPVVRNVRPELDSQSDNFDARGTDRSTLGQAVYQAANEIGIGLFATDMSISKKLQHSLRLLKKGTSRQVAEKTFELDNSRTLDQWVKESRFHLSKLYNEKKLIVLKDDNERGNVYAFPL